MPNSRPIGPIDTPRGSIGHSRMLQADNKNRRYVVFVDLDSTLSDTRPRQHLLHPEDRERTDWEAYSLGCYLDEPFEGPIRLVQSLYKGGYTIVIVSSRMVKSLHTTEGWLYHYNVPYDDILLRDDALHTGSVTEYKRRRVEEFIEQTGWIPHLLIDDWPPMSEAFEGLCPVVVVNPMYDTPTAPIQVAETTSVV